MGTDQAEVNPFLPEIVHTVSSEQREVTETVPPCLALFSCNKDSHLHPKHISRSGGPENIGDETVLLSGTRFPCHHVWVLFLNVGSRDRTQTLILSWQTLYWLRQLLRPRTPPQNHWKPFLCQTQVSLWGSRSFRDNAMWVKFLIRRQEATLWYEGFALFLSWAAFCICKMWSFWKKPYLPYAPQKKEIPLVHEV